MIYSQLYLKDKFRVPTILTLIIIVVMTILLARFFTNTSEITRASNKKLKRIEIGNVSPFQAAVFWQTDTPAISWIMLGDSENQLNRSGFDERDIASKKNPFINHYAILRDLKENHQYFIKIVSNNELISKSDGKAFTFTTPANTRLISNLSPAYGKVVKSNNQPLENAIVIVKIDNLPPLFTLTKSTGEWLIPLNEIPGAIKNKQIKIEIINEDSKISSNVVAELSGLSPLPQTIIMGKDYDFTQKSNVLSVQTSDREEFNKTIDIIYPQENAKIPGTIPLIKGISSPNSEIQITVQSEKIFSAKVTSDSTGTWSYTLPESLALGPHVITISTKDNKGETITIQRNFIIIGQEGGNARVLGTTADEPVISGAPTKIPTATIIPTSIPTYYLLPTDNTASPSAPVSGVSNFIIPAISGLSLMIVGLGIILAF